MLRNLFRRVGELFAGAREVTDELFGELEEVLIASDVSVRVSGEIVGLLRGAARERRVHSAEEVRDLLRSHLVAVLMEGSAPLVVDLPAGRQAGATEPPLFYLMVGVNGTGKTTTIAKLAHRFQRQGR